MKQTIWYALSYLRKTQADVSSVITTGGRLVTQLFLMDAETFLDSYRSEAEKLVTEYLARILRIGGALTANKIAERFWDFNVLMQEMEHALNEKASEMIDLYRINTDLQNDIQTGMKDIAREACRKFNKLGKPGSGNK